MEARRCRLNGPDDPGPFPWLLSTVSEQQSRCNRLHLLARAIAEPVVDDAGMVVFIDAVGPIHPPDPSGWYILIGPRFLNLETNTATLGMLPDSPPTRFVSMRAAVRAAKAYRKHERVVHGRTRLNLRVVECWVGFAEYNIDTGRRVDCKPGFPPGAG